MIPAFIIDRLRSLLVPELSDLRQQLADARRLAGEAQGRFREAEREIDKWRGRSHDLEVYKLAPLGMERDQLRARVAELEAERSKMLEGSAQAELRPNLTTEGAPIPRAVWDALVEHTKPRPTHLPDGKPITYVDPDQPRHSLKPTKY